MGHRSVTVFRILAVLWLTFVAIFLQAALNWPRQLLGAQVNLLPAMMVWTAFRLGLGSVVLISLAGGLGLDALSLNPLGVSCLPLCLAGTLLHLKREQLLGNEPFAQWIIGLVVCAITPLLTLGLVLTLGANPLLGAGFLWDWIVLTLVGGAATPVLFWLMDRLERALTYQPHSELSFRPDREIRRGRF